MNGLNQLLYEIRKIRLISASALDLIEKGLTEWWPIMSRNNKMLSVNFLT